MSDESVAAMLKAHKNCPHASPVCANDGVEYLAFWWRGKVHITGFKWEDVSEAAP